MARSEDDPTAEEIAEYLDDIPLGRIAEAFGILVARSARVGEPQDRVRMLRPDDITDQYGIDRRWIYAHAAELGAVKTGRRTMLVPESNLLRYLDDHRVANGRR